MNLVEKEINWLEPLDPNGNIQKEFRLAVRNSQGSVIFIDSFTYRLKTYPMIFLHF